MKKPLHILTLLLAIALVAALAGCTPAATASKAAWPPSPSGKPTFYYFGTPS